MARPCFHLLGKYVFMEAGLLAGSEFNAVLRKYHMRPAANDASAELFIVADIMEPGPVVSCIAGISGCMVGSVAFFRSGGMEGAVASYLPSLCMQKKLYVSDAFSNEKPDVARVLRGVVSSANSNWKTIRTFEEWLQLQVRQKSPSKFIALVTAAEKQQHAALSRHKYCMTLDMFLQHVLRVDDSRTALGIGRST